MFSGDSYLKAASLRFFVFLLFALCFAREQASAKIFDGGVDSKNLGKGEWIYVLSETVNGFGEANVASVNSVNTMMDYCKNNLHLQFLIIKAGEGGNLFGAPQFTPSLVAAAHAKGLKIFGYTRSYGIDIAGESAVADYVYNDCGADGFVLDAEADWESSRLGTTGPGLAWQLCGQIKTNWPNKFLGHSPLPVISSHSSFPYREFGYWCDTVMPQDYWVSFADNGHGTPASTVTWMDDNFRTFQNSLAGMGNTSLGTRWTNAIKPLAPIGQAYTSAPGTDETGADLSDFVNYLQTDPGCVTAGGYKGCSFFRTGQQTQAMLDAIGSTVIGDYAPSISTQPLSQTLAIGQVMNLNVVAIGPPTPLYQWRKNGNAIAGATKSFYSRANIQLSDAGTYSVFLTNSLGSLLSSNADVNVQASPSPPTIATPPQSQALAPSQIATFTVVANGTSPLSYKWFLNGAAISGATATNTSYNITNVQAGNAGTYSVRVTNSVGSVTSQVAVLSIVNDVIIEIYLAGGALNSNPPYTDAAFVNSASSAKSTAAGLSGTGCRYSTGGSGTPSCTFKPTLATAGGTYDVYLTHTLSSSSGDMVASITRTGFTGLPDTTDVFKSAYANTWASVGQMKLNPGVTLATVKFTYSTGTLDGTHRMYSDAVKFSISAAQPPSVLTPPQTQTANFGTNLTFTVALLGTGPLTYQWQWNGTNIAGATQGTLRLPNLQFTNAGPYTVVVGNTSGSITSAVAQLTVVAPFFQFNSIARTPDGKIHLQIDGDAGSYVVEASPDFASWQALTNAVVNGSSVECIDPVTNALIRFYRARVGP
jgi:hypothetical protein